MPLFRYQTLGDRGVLEVGYIQARDLLDARQGLQRQKRVVVELKAFTPKTFPTLSRQERLTLTRELQRLLLAGLPLFEALSILEEKYRKEKIHPLLLDLCYRVQSGESFSTALAMHPSSFDLLYSAMVANAEKGFRLEQALGHLIQLQEKQLYIRKQMMAALLYPALLGGFCLVVLSMLLFFVIPSLRELFEGRPLHPFTLFVFACSEYAIRAKWFLVALFGGAIGCSIALRSSLAWKRHGMALILRLPFLKPLFLKAAWARFCRTSATLLEGGVPLLEALAQGRKVMCHPRMEAIVALAEREIAEGRPIAAALQRSSEVPPLIPRMVGIAEEGGTLPFMMHQIAQIQEEELEKTLHALATLAQPILLLVLGVVVGFVLLSVLLPLTDVDSFLSL